MRVLITGGCGFIGTNLIQYLLETTDWDIINVDSLTYASNRPIENKRVRWCEININDKDDMAGGIENHSPSVVVHLAAETHVDNSIHSPVNFINTNIVGTFNVLECCRKHNVRLHHVSTDEVFGQLGATGSFNEDSPYLPRSPYSASKAASDHLVRSYYHTYGLPITISNCSNNYGPYQHKEKFIPVIINALIENKKIPVYGEGKNVRDWLYVQDHCRAIKLILEKGRIGETYCVGGGRESSNIDIVNLLCDQYYLKTGNKRHGNVRFVKDRPGHDFRYSIDCAKIREELRYKPQESFESGIEKTLDWYIENH